MLALAGVRWCDDEDEEYGAVATLNVLCMRSESEVSTQGFLKRVGIGEVDMSEVL